jgi:hypothetical protein
MFKPGKNCNGYFNSKELILQVDRVIEIFEAKTNGLAQGLFLFDNAPSHLKHAPDAISARKMVKSEFYYSLCCFVLSMSPRSKVPLDTRSEGATHVRLLRFHMDRLCRLRI